MFKKLKELPLISEPKQLTKLSEKEATELQQVLRLLGYKSVVADGVVGYQTTFAFVDWKLKHSLNEPELIGSGSVKLLIKDLQTFDLGRTIDWEDFDSKVSMYFTVREVANDSKDRIPRTDKVKTNVLTLAKELDKIREAWGKPIIVTSWYRPAAVNKSVGGAKNSQHLYGAAVDIKTTSDIYEFQEWLDERWGNRALGYGAKKGFVHLDLRPFRYRWNY